ncbi:hypothetical protein TNCV_4583901 [Trichonephila clavipes]|nr:hypothetical protein TNCV_4583901 [Trichonephila clavipes]
MDATGVREESGIKKRTVHRILRIELHLRKITARWVPHALTEVQRCLPHRWLRVVTVARDYIEGLYAQVKSVSHLIKFSFKIKVTIWFNESHYRESPFTPHGPPSGPLEGHHRPLVVDINPFCGLSGLDF